MRCVAWLMPVLMLLMSTAMLLVIRRPSCARDKVRLWRAFIVVIAANFSRWYIWWDWHASFTPETFNLMWITWILWQFTLVTVGITLLVPRFLEHLSWAELGWRKEGIIGSLAYGLIMGLFTTTLVMPRFTKAVTQVEWVGLSLWITSEVLVVTIAEEAVFRGYLLAILRDFFKDTWTANWTQAIVFALTHIPLAFVITHYATLDFNYVQWLLQRVAWAFGLGVLWGWLRNKTQNILAPIVAHTVHNIAVQLPLVLAL